MKYTPFFDEEESVARERFEELKLEGYKELYLIHSGHWASSGYWVEHVKPQLSSSDSVIEEYIVD